MKTSELLDGPLDWAVAKALGVECGINKLGGISVDTEQENVPEGMNPYDDYRWQKYSPSTIWAQGGPIMDQAQIDTYLYQKDLGHWVAEITGIPSYRAGGTTRLIAAMRCLVASKLGDEIEVPEELCK